MNKWRETIQVQIAEVEARLKVKVRETINLELMLHQLKVQEKVLNERKIDVQGS